VSCSRESSVAHHASQPRSGSPGSSLRPVNGTRLCAISSGAGVTTRETERQFGPLRASDASRYPIGLMAYASGARALCRKFFESDDRPVHFVQIRPASQAEW
jgi:hypothetical protein